MSGIPVSGDAEIAPVASDEARLAPPHRGFGRNVLSVMRGTVLGQVVTVIATPIVSRLFSPGVFGEFTLVVSVAAAASALAGFRYETAIPLARSDDEANATFAVAMAGVVLVALLTLVLCAGFPTLPGRFRDLSALREWRFAIPALVLLAGGGQSLSNMAIRNRQFEELSWFKVNQTLPVAVLQIGLGLLASRGPSSLVLASILGQLAACLLLGIAVARARSSRERRRVTGASMREAMSHFRNFPLFMTPYGLVSVGRERAVYVLLGLFSSTSVVGMYALAYRLTLMPISLITASLSPVMFQRASAARDIREVEGLIQTLLIWLVRLSVPAFVLAAVAAQRFAGVVLGLSWQSVGTYVAVLSLPAWLMLHTTWLDRMLDRLDLVEAGARDRGRLLDRRPSYRHRHSSLVAQRTRGNCRVRADHLALSGGLAACSLSCRRLFHAAARRAWSRGSPDRCGFNGDHLASRFPAAGAPRDRRQLRPAPLVRGALLQGGACNPGFLTRRQRSTWRARREDRRDQRVLLEFAGGRPSIIVGDSFAEIPRLPASWVRKAHRRDFRHEQTVRHVGDNPVATRGCRLPKRARCRTTGRPRHSGNLGRPVCPSREGDHTEDG